MRHNKITSLAMAVLLGASVTYGAVAPAAAAPAGSPVNCNYGYVVVNTIAYRGTGVWSKQRQGTNLKQKLHINPNNYPSLETHVAYWGYGFRQVTSTGWSGHGTAAVDIFSADCEPG